MRSENEVVRDWNAGTIIDGLAKGGRYFYVDDDGCRHEFYMASNGEITASGEIDRNGKKERYQNQGDIVMLSVFKKDVFTKIQRMENIKTLPYRDEQVYQKMDAMANEIHKRIEAKHQGGMNFDEAWEVVGDELAVEILLSKGKYTPPSKSSNKFVEDLKANINEEPDPKYYGIEEGKSTPEQNRENPTVPGELE